MQKGACQVDGDWNGVAMMRVKLTVKRLAWGILAVGLVLVPAPRVFAHCDGLDGPVVKAAQRALETRDPALVLIWVGAEDEAEILSAFEQTLGVRALSPQAKELADRFFFETVVRVHRVGEGAPFTGLKPAGRDLGPAIPGADTAIEEGSLEKLSKLLNDATRESLHEHFNTVLAAKAFKREDVAAGREFVKAYVQFIHYVERLYETATTSKNGHFGEALPAAHDRSLVDQRSVGCRSEMSHKY